MKLIFKWYNMMKNNTVYTFILIDYIIVFSTHIYKTQIRLNAAILKEYTAEEGKLFGIKLIFVLKKFVCNQMLNPLKISN